MLISRRVIGATVLLWIFASITIGLQFWVGEKTIYADTLEIRREELHRAILENKAPGGKTWAAAGAASIQKRVAIVYLAEGLHQASGLTTGKVYKILDSLFLFASMVALFMYLRRWLPPVYCLLGVLYFCAVLPLTYFFQLFHPWDRPQLLLWIILLYLVAERRLILLALCLALSIVVKFDTIFFPFLYFAVYISGSEWRRISLEAMFLLALSIGLNAWLGQAFPDSQEVSRYSLGVIRSVATGNAQKLFQMNFKFPPLLVHLMPMLLAFAALGRKDRFLCCSVLFALGMTVIHVLLTNYEEVRAHMMVLVLVMPAALLSARAMLEHEPRSVRAFGENCG